MDQYHLRMVALFEAGNSRYEYYINCGGITVMRAVESGEAQWFEVVTPHMELNPITDFNEANRILSERVTSVNSSKAMSEVFERLLASEMTQLINHYMIQGLARGDVSDFLLRGKITVFPRNTGKITQSNHLRGHDSLCFHVDCGKVTGYDNEYKVEYCPGIRRIILVNDDGDSVNYLSDPSLQAALYYLVGVAPERNIHKR